MEIIQTILKNNPCYKANKPLKVTGLMLHSVGTPQPFAMVFVNNWNKATYDRACVHAFIDANSGDVYQTLPWNMRGWHAGGSANNTHIGVEMCEPDCIKYTGGASFTCSDVERAKSMVTRTYNSAVELFAKLCIQYNLDPMKDICSHSEGYKKGIASNHADPEHLWKGLGLPFTMDTFRKAVADKMSPVYGASDWAMEAVKWAIDNNIIEGYSNGDMGLQNPLTREQFCVMLYRYDQMKK